jgi:4-aminobutyrate aminotransferase
MNHLSPLLKQSSDVMAVRGEGAYLIGADDRRYLDFTSGIGVTATGHCHPHVVEAVRKQAGELLHGQYATVQHPGLMELADRLSERLPGSIDSVCFANAGTEAVETAIRLARHATGRTNIIAFQGGFHGRTVGSASLTTSASKIREGQQPLMAGVTIAPFPHVFRWGWTEKQATDFCLAELDHILATESAPSETAAMIVEPVQGEAGYMPATPGFLAGLRERCDRHGILLILDEIQSGYGRTGRFWAHETDGIVPDMIVTAKGLASGMPLSALAAPADLMAKGHPGSQGGTYGGNAVACAAALATLEVFDRENLVENAAARGEQLMRSLEGIQQSDPRLGDVRGRGIMLGVEMVDGAGKPDGALAEKILHGAEREGLLLLRCGAQGQVVRWLPPLIVTEQQVDDAVGCFRSVLSTLH